MMPAGNGNPMVANWPATQFATIVIDPPWPGGNP